MKFHVNHPVLTTAIHRRSSERRATVGLVATEIELVAISTGDLNTAFVVEENDPVADKMIMEFDGSYYEELGWDLPVLLSNAPTFEELDVEMEAFAPRILPIGTRLAAAVRKCEREGSFGPLFPAPRSPRVLVPDMVDDDREDESHAVSYLSKTGRLPQNVDELCVAEWRNSVRATFSNFIVAGGKTYAKTGVPVYRVTAQSLSPTSTASFSRYIDGIVPSLHGGIRTNLAFNGMAGVYFRPSELHEARHARLDIARKSQSKNPLLDSPRITCHVDVELEDLECLDIARIAKYHLYEARATLRSYERQWGRMALERQLADSNSSQSKHLFLSDRLREALDAYELANGVIDEVEAALRAIQPTTNQSRFYRWESSEASQLRVGALDAATTVAMERLDARPIALPDVSRQHAVTRPSP